MKDLNEALASFIFETGMLTAFKRSGFDFLGGCSQNIASHSFRTAVIGYVLACEREGADAAKTVLLCLFHDISEIRTGDINYYQMKYVQKDEERATEDICRDLGKASSIKGYIKEFNERSSTEAALANDADVLELVFTLKEELDKGNPQAEIWLKNTVKRLSTKEGKNLAKSALKQKYYDWWIRSIDS